MLFVLLGMTGLVWSIFAYLILYDWPETHPRISSDELQYIQLNRAVTYGGKGIKRVRAINTTAKTEK